MGGGKLRERRKKGRRGRKIREESRVSERILFVKQALDQARLRLMTIHLLTRQFSPHKHQALICF